MKRTEPPSAEEFDRLLDWLDPDRERAGEKFLEIRSKVTKILVRRQCYAAEELWDETYSRVSHRVKDVAPTWVGDPALYFYAVARLVHLEWIRYEKWKREQVDYEPPQPPRASEDIERIYDCLERCRQELDLPEDRELILKYYEKDKRAKIDHRKELADERGMTLNTLRMKVHRINGKLEKCIVACLDESTEASHVLAG